jgi:hypothetical protein
MQNQKPVNCIAGSSRFTRFTTFLLVCTALGVAACTGTSAMLEPAGAQYHVNNTSQSSQVTVSNEADSALVEVVSDSGIGSATVALVSGSWPDSIKLHFHLQGLESLDFVFDETTVNVSISTQDMILQSVSIDGTPAQEIDEGSDYWMAVSFKDEEGATVSSPASAGVIVVDVPSAFLAGGYSEFTINWIDFYR